MSELASVFRSYEPRQEAPLTGYAVAMAAYALVLGGVLSRLVRPRRFQPSWEDVATLGVATHKLSRLITKASITSPLRAPFGARRATEGAGEVHDEARGSGLRRSVGQLLTCPYCADPWLATGLTGALACRPLETRFVLRLLAVVTVADFLHLSYAGLNESRKKASAERRPEASH
jgi:hypothetical protein